MTKNDDGRVIYLTPEQRVAMTMTGHKTRSVFDRYHIVSPGDLQDAARRLTGIIRAQSPSQVVDTPHVNP